MEYESPDESREYEPFKGQFCTMKFQYRVIPPGEQQHFAKILDQEAENIPRGGAYWMEDIIENLDSVCD